MSPEHPALAASRQLLLVLAPQWESGSGQLFQYQRSSPGAPWKLLQVVPVSLGRTGLAWGQGLHGINPADGPQKREGDGKSPAGIFALGPAFGYDPQSHGRPDALPYLQVTDQTRGIEDPHSQHYNTIIDASQTPQDWSGADHMLRPDGLYRYGVMVQHNPQPGPQNPALGSCIFLHIWRGPGQTTAGCTAMEASRMQEIRDWLSASAEPRLVQLTEADYRRLRDAWGLPKTSELCFNLFALICSILILGCAVFLWSRRRYRNRRSNS